MSSSIAIEKISDGSYSMYPKARSRSAMTAVSSSVYVLSITSYGTVFASTPIFYVRRDAVRIQHVD